MEHSFIYKAERPWPNRRLKVAAIIGHTTTDSTRLWLRTAAPGDYEILLYACDANDGPDGINALLGEIPFRVSKLPSACRRIPFNVPSFERDSTHVEDIGSLQPDTGYRYALLGTDPIGGQKRVLLGQDTPLEFRTFPDDRSKPLELALFSCNKPFKKTIFNNTRLENDAMWEGFNRALGQRGPSQVRFIIGGALLGLASDDEGDTREGHAYKRLALYKDANFSIIRVDPQSNKVEFKLYGRDAALEMDVEVPGAGDLRPEAHPIANIELGF